MFRVLGLKKSLQEEEEEEEDFGYYAFMYYYTPMTMTMSSKSFFSSFSSMSAVVPAKKVTTTTTTTVMTSRRRRRRRNGRLFCTEDDYHHHHFHHRSFKGEKEQDYSSDAHSRGKPNNAKSEPYRFMGRTVKEDHVFDSRMAKEFALDVVSEETGVSRDDLEKNLGSLKSLLPEVSSTTSADAYRASLNIKLVARNAIKIKSVFKELKSNVSEMIAKDLRFALDERASEKCERALEILTKNGEMEREEAENLIYATHRFCADKDKMLAFCEEQTLLEVCENVKRIRLAVGKTFLAHKVAEKGDAAVNMLFESEKNTAACDAAKQLVQRMPNDCNVGLMVSDFPNLLLMDIDRLFSDLTSAFKSTPPEETLRRDPSVSFRVRSFNNSYEDDGFSEDDRI